MLLKFRSALPILVTLLISPLFLNPNPFGDNTAVISDESYFLSSALSALSNHTLPGWDFTVGGAYYGGVQTYLVTVAVLIRFLYTRNRLKQLGLLAALFLSVLFSNPLFVLLIHTGKVWLLGSLFMLTAGGLVLFQEYFITRTKNLLIEKRVYISLLLWLAFLAILQVPMMIHVVLWVVFAMLLGHISISETVQALKCHIGIFLLIILTQLSFYQRILNLTSSVATSTSLNGTDYLFPDGSIDWLKRFAWLFQTLWESNPVLVVSFLFIFAFYLVQLPYSHQLGSRRRKLIVLLICLLYPVAVFTTDVVIAGLIGYPRYAIIFSLAITMSFLFLFTTLSNSILTLFIPPFAIFAIYILLKVMLLFWSPSSGMQVYQFFYEKYNTPDQLIVIDAKHLELPLNRSSFQFLDVNTKALRRNQFLIDHPDMIDRFIDFRPIVYYQNSSFDVLPIPQTHIEHIWRVTSDCSRSCTENEDVDSCISINASSCDVRNGSPQNVTTLYGTVKSKNLGYPYFLRYAKY